MAVRRRKARGQDAQAKYDAAGNGRRVAGWRPPSSGPNVATQGLQAIRNRSRDAARNDWAGESALQKWATNLVGTGIVPRWSEAEDITKRWNRWVPLADADGVLDFYGLQTLATRSWLDGGEVFARRRPRLYVYQSPAPVQVQLIEAEFCPLFDADTWVGMPVGNTIRQGIERNKRGARVAYWMYREHPGDASSGLPPSVDKLIRVPARDVAHIFEPKRPGQLRGVSQLAPVLLRLRSSMDFEDAVLDRQKLANLFTLFITQQMPPDTADIDYDPLTGLPTFFNEEGKALVGLEPGISQKLMPGEDVKFANPPEAGTTYSDYMRTTHMGTAAGSGLPYELFSGDLRDVSDRTLRVIVNEFRRFAKQRQWQILIPQFCQRVVEWWAEADALAGGLSLSQFEAARAPTWAPNGWEYIHPTQDAEGKKLEVEAGFRSRSDVISERGDDPATVDAERAADLARSKDHGLEPPPPPKPAAPPPPTAQERAGVRMLDDQAAMFRAQRAAIENQPTAADLAAQRAEEQETLLRLVTAGIVEAVKASNEKPATPVTVEARIDVQPTPIENHTHVQPTPIENKVEVTVPPAEPPVVNVSVEPHLTTPARETVSVIEHDDDTGRIKKVVQTEKAVLQ